MSKHPESVPALLEALRDLRETNPKAVRSNIHLYPAAIYTDNGEGSSTGHERDRRITSWKMTEHLYFSANNPFPTLARGLFTEELEDGDKVPPGSVDENGMVLRRERIVARGYDKFFNVDEVPWTCWKAMEKYSAPPYHLTLKSNGCLILISALTPSHLVVASKHSLGTTTEAQQGSNTAVDKHGEALQANVVTGTNSGSGSERPADAQLPGRASEGVNGDSGGKATGKEKAGNIATGGSPARPDDAVEEAQDQAHAAVGRMWLKRTLARKGKTEAQLARRLWEENVTAVLELCDDSFEEHVIATPKHWTGLHLHGLNRNTAHFSTLSPPEVTAFAEEFGFIPTKTVEKGDLDSVREFTDDIAKTGSWEGDVIEGFVVRGTVREDLEGEASDAPPYRPGAPFFFKIKFDEPYLLYRQWREVTRAMLPLVDTELPESKKEEIWAKVRKRIKRPEQAVYADWVGATMASEPGLFDDFNRGIVRIRNRFLAWTEVDGKDDWKSAQDGSYKLKGPKRSPDHANESDKAGKSRGKKGKGTEPAERDIATLPKKWILVPCAIPGTGKTLIGLALSKLYGFGHTQSDDVTTKKSAPTFLKNITELLRTTDVVYADRNNHIGKHYKELGDLHNEKALRNFNVRIIPIIWDIESQPFHRILRVASERIVRRGDNHQTLRPDKTINAEHEAVISKFRRDFTSPDEDYGDFQITVNVDAAPEETLRKIIDGVVVGHLGLSTRSDSEIKSSLENAAEYRVTGPYRPPNKVGHDIRYFGIAPEIDLVAIVEIAVYYMPPELAHYAQRFLSGLQRNNRIITTPHITLCHSGNVATEKASAESASNDARASPNDTATPPGLHERTWNTCKKLCEGEDKSMWDYDMTHLVWDGRVMAIIVDNLRPRGAGDMDGLDDLLKVELEEGLHITVGTRDEEVRPFEARRLVQIARKRILAGEANGTDEAIVEGGGDLRWASLGVINGEGRLKGMF